MIFRACDFSKINHHAESGVEAAANIYGTRIGPALHSGNSYEEGYYVEMSPQCIQPVFAEILNEVNQTPFCIWHYISSYACQVDN